MNFITQPSNTAMSTTIPLMSEITNYFKMTRC